MKEQQHLEFTEDTVENVPFAELESFTPTIQLSRDTLPIAIRHGMELYWDDSTPKKRLDQRGDKGQFNRFVNARVEGKLAEVAFSKFMYTYYGIKSQVDWRIYGEYTETDDGDLQHIVDDAGNTYELGVDFDLKKTKPWNQWLAIRDSIYQHLSPVAPVVLSKMSIEDDLDVSDWEHADGWDEVDEDREFRQRLLSFADDVFPLSVELVGSVYPDEFTDYFEQGDHLYSPNSGRELGQPLRCDNRGVHESNLNSSPKRWDQVVEDIVGTAPIEYTPLLEN